VKRISLPLLAVGTLVLTSCSLTLWDYSNIASKRFALVYGVAMYESGVSPGPGKAPNLSFPSDDASSMATMLTAEGYTVVSRWVDINGNVYVDGQPKSALPTLTDAPTKATITTDLSDMAGLVGPDDVFVFYFSGHGMQDVSVSPPVEYFVPEGAVSGAGGSEPLSISDAEFGSLLAPIASKRKVVILDTCNSGGFIGNTLEADAIPAVSLGSFGSISLQALAQALDNFLSFSTSTPALSPYGGAMVLSASGRDESCYETPTWGHGVMTYFLIQARQSGDLNHDGHVTVGEAFSLAKAGIETDWNTAPYVQSHAEQFEPRVSGGPVDFVLW